VPLLLFGGLSFRAWLNVGVSGVHVIWTGPDAAGTAALGLCVCLFPLVQVVSVHSICGLTPLWVGDCCSERCSPGSVTSMLYLSMHHKVCEQNPYYGL
jgi:hypothetical protein